MGSISASRCRGVPLASRIPIAQRQHLEPLRLPRALQWDTARPTIGGIITGCDGQGGSPGAFRSPEGPGLAGGHGPGDLVGQWVVTPCSFWAQLCNLPHAQCGGTTEGGLSIGEPEPIKGAPESPSMNLDP